MRTLERLASAYIGRRLELLRLGRGLTAEAMAQKVDMAGTTYRWREIGVSPITVEFLLRCHLVLGPDALNRLWYPVGGPIAVVDDSILEAQIEAWSEQDRPATYQQIIELCAEAFGVPVGAVTGGLNHEKVRKARAAAALVVASRAHLCLAEHWPLWWAAPTAAFGGCGSKR